MYILRSSSIHFARSVYYQTFLLFTSALRFEIQLPKGEDIDLFDRFNTVTLMSLLQIRTWIFFVFNDLRREMIFLLYIGRIFNQSNTTGLASGTGTANPSETPEVTVRFQWVRFARSFVFYILLDRCLFALFLLAIVFSIFLVELPFLKLTQTLVRVTPWVLLVEQELLTPVSSWVRFAQSLVICVDHCLSFLFQPFYYLVSSIDRL